MARPWFRFYTEALYDRKLRRLTPAQRWLWVAILGAARQSCVPGYLLVSERHAMDEDDLADVAGMSTKQVAASIPVFLAAGLIDVDVHLGCWHVPAWNERQFESDVSTDRVKRFRERCKAVSETPSESDSDTDLLTVSELPPSSYYPDDDGWLWTRVAQLRLAKQPAGSVKSVHPWLRTTAERAKEELGRKAHELVEAYDVSLERLAECLADGGQVPASWKYDRRPA